MSKRGAAQAVPLFDIFYPTLTPNNTILESGFSKFLGVVDVATVDDDGVLHGLFHHAEARHAELFPFGDEQQCVGIEQCFVRVIGDVYIALTTRLSRMYILNIRS